MSSTSQQAKRAASEEPPITHRSKPQILKRAASAEPQYTNQSKRQKRQEQDDAEEGAISNPAPETHPESQPEQSPDAHREGSRESREDSDDGEAEDLPRRRAKRSKWMNTVDKFSTHGNDTGFLSDELKKKGHNSRPQMLPDERKQLMEDLAKRTDTSEPQGQPKVGLDFMSDFSTTVDSPKDAATFLGINLQSLEISPKSTLRLRIDQVQNIAFMVKKAEGMLKGCVNANDYGTGKTIEALASIFFLAQRQEACPNFGTHKAALVLSTHQALRGWQEAHATYFSGLLNLCICSDSLPPDQHSQLIDPPSASALTEFLDTLSPSDPETSRTVILCTYGELSSTEFLVKRKKEDARQKELSLRGSKLNDEALEALKVAQKPGLYDLNFSPAMIGTLIADEAHEIKHPKSRKAQTAYLLDTDIQFLLTANPVDNKISDFRGLLFALYKSNEWQINWPKGDQLEGVLRMFDDDFDPFEITDSGTFVPHNASPEYVQALRNGQHLWRLNPHAYRWLAHHMKFGPEFARRILGSIYRLCLLRRGVVSVVTMPSSGSSTVSGILALPPVSIRTIEVSRGHEEEEYHDLASRGFDLLFTGGGENSTSGAARVINDNETPLAPFNNFWDTFLCHITADLGLADVRGDSWFSETPASRGNQPDMKNLIRNNTDSGMSFYYSMTRRETDPDQPPADRASMIRHIVRRSPKLRWLLIKLEELKLRGEKVIVYCVHPLTQWLVEGVCAMAEFNFLSQRSKPRHDDETRAAVIGEFNNPAKRYDFLLSTMRVLGHGVDLHTDCHNVIIFELPDSIPTMLSAMGRIRRVGQTKPQEIWILTMKDSYDDHILYRQSSKHAKSILAFGVLGERLDKLASRVNARVERHRTGLQRMMPRIKKEIFLQKLEREMPILDVVKLLAAGELLRRHLGARHNTSHIPWTCRHRILFGCQEMHLNDFARAKMDFNTVTGRIILHLVAQLPATGHPFAGVGPLPRRLQD
ncbi:hypothetical protein INS49_002551 [Diaporthe citri]|uniref:uncharacterized protein n=1 Tax=Diaporthe citri TaxID=83186 RepID=UPI001C80DCD5|nr:uncharacterized protein INS49_002551 [Diaporthe citri]KAG6368346.1 hypothetical protein INS49_002551 [Diaporthe citri]